ncbi:MAG: aminotransferase class III-fold pyridoxal phosphate-dependent enzyme [Actinomycetota bacterium]|nr:aminotransferase class III-fold pyridoxal phosphate-dependent enzyme [Actinomycetota bacterium]
MRLTSSEIQTLAAEAERRYIARNPESQRLHEERRHVMPGGNTRTVIHVPPFPLTIVRGEGAQLIDADGHVYTDLLGDFTAGLYGHSHPAIVGAIREALDDGLAFGAPNLYEGRLARSICARFKSVELVRFCNSGTEANLLALSLARVASGRGKIMVFEGGYHGSVFYFASRSGSPINAPFPFVVAPYNDIEGSMQVAAEHAGDLAAVLVEPLQGSSGAIVGDPQFLRALRSVTSEHDALLIFDEVMTSRLSPGGLQEVLGITPDLTTFGKYLGGGLAFGAFGGRSELMSRFDPERADSLLHAGTFNNAVLTMAAGAAGLSQIYTPAEIERLNRLGDRLRERLNEFAAGAGLPFSVSGYGSILALHFTPGPIRRVSDIPAAEALRTLLHFHLLEAGYSYARRGFIALSVPHEEADVDGFAAAVAEFLSHHASTLRRAVQAASR